MSCASLVARCVRANSFFSASVIEVAPSNPPLPPPPSPPPEIINVSNSASSCIDDVVRSFTLLLSAAVAAMASGCGLQA